MKAEKGLVRRCLLSLSLSPYSFRLSLFGRYPRIYDVRKTAGWLARESREGGAEQPRRKAAASESIGGAKWRREEG